MCWKKNNDNQSFFMSLTCYWLPTQALIFSLFNSTSYEKINRDICNFTDPIKITQLKKYLYNRMILLAVNRLSRWKKLLWFLLWRNYELQKKLSIDGIAAEAEEKIKELCKQFSKLRAALESKEKELFEVKLMLEARLEIQQGATDGSSSSDHKEWNLCIIVTLKFSNCE